MPIKIYIIVFLSQLFFNIAKVLEIKLTYENKTSGLLVNSIFLNLVSLMSVYYSIGNLLKGDVFIIFFYVSGSVLGKWIGMTRFENYRAKIFGWIKFGGKKE
jgi:hypothetical protein